MPTVASRITKKTEVRRPQRTAFTLTEPTALPAACVRCLPSWSRRAKRRRGPRTQSTQHIGEPQKLNSVPGTWPCRAPPPVSSAPRTPTQLASAASHMTWRCKTQTRACIRPLRTRRLCVKKCLAFRRRVHSFSSPHLPCLSHKWECGRTDSGSARPWCRLESNR